jgi:hypothetical protein
MMLDPSELADNNNSHSDPLSCPDNNGYLEYSLTDLLLTSPQDLAFLEISGSRRSWEIMKSLYKKFPPFNPAWLDFRRELDASCDRKIFKQNYSPGDLPLYKGKMIRQFNGAAGPARYWLDPLELDRHLLAKNISRLINDISWQFKTPGNFKDPFFGRNQPGRNLPGQNLPVKNLLAFLNLKSPADLGQFVIPERNFRRLAFRAISSDTNERTLIAAIVPKNIGAQHSIYLSLAGRYYLDPEAKKIAFQPMNPKKLLFCLALFNSLTVDWIIRALVTTNVLKNHIFKIPCPSPADDELENIPLYKSIISYSAGLSLYASQQLSDQLKDTFELSEIRPLKTLEDFHYCQDQLDILIAQLYGLDIGDLKYLAQSFKVLKSKNPLRQFSGQ